ncbi:AAA family ATPase [Candidatus Chloroploca sp. Khr17]|uniref:ATP-binding protein n=1 Tax=Candidatus Chloroploca sp. Khr17 TaxID=2496869 RepID=UPI001F1190E8|nr:AAA family ATPase [Candidatus Chloroploca sp. Khr17]
MAAAPLRIGYNEIQLLPMGVVMLVVTLFGAPRLVRDGVIVELPRRRARALVYYLAAQTAPVSREQLLGLFWPDHDRSGAQQLLRTTLHAVRRALGPALVSGEYQLGLEADVDYRTLLATIQKPNADEAALAWALHGYRDDLLTDFSLADAEPFEDWLAAERERARMLAIRGFTRLARLAEGRQAYQVALDALRQALAFDPLQEDLQRDAMRLHYYAGDRVGAIRRYEHLQDLLDAEVGVPPMQATRELYDALITDALVRPPAEHVAVELSRAGEVSLVTRPSAPTPLQPPSLLALPFIGRQTELALIAEAVTQGQLVLIEGEPGIGKTRLATEFLGQHVAEHGLVLVGAARELEQSLPYQPVIAALRMLATHPRWSALRAQLDLAPLWLREVARLVPELAEALPGQPIALGNAEEARLWEGVAQLVMALVRHVPVGLLLDDLHWADASTLGLVSYLLRRSQGTQVSVLATTRPVPPRHALATLRAGLTRENHLRRLALQRLHPTETAFLAQQLCPHDVEATAAWIQQTTEGNPYILVEVLSHALATGMLGPDGHLHLDSATAPIVPPTVYSLIEARLTRLAEGARRVLDAAVVAGREFEFEVAARAAALSEQAALDALDELQAARLVEPLDERRYRFDHSLTVEVAGHELGIPRQRSLHRRIAEAMEALHRNELDAMAGMIAWHFAQGGAPERAAEYALRAARRATAVAAWSEATALFAQALAGSQPAERFVILLDLGEALAQQGEGARAAERLREALALATNETQANHARLKLAGVLVAQARYAEVIDLVRDLATQGTPGERAQALFRWGTALSLEGADLGEAALRLGEAERLVIAQASLDQTALAQVRFELGSVAAQQGDLPRAVAYYHEAMHVADAVSEAPDRLNQAMMWRILARNNLAYHLHLLGDLEPAEGYLGEALKLAEAAGFLGLQPYLLSTKGELALAREQLDHAEQAFSAGLALAERLDVPERIAGLVANLGLVALRRGETSLAIHRLSTAQAQADALGTHHLAAQIRIWLAPLLPPHEARTLFAEARGIAEAGKRQRLLDELAHI